MSILLTLAGILISCCALSPNCSGFQVDSGVQITNGISRVAFNLDKGFRSRFAGCPIGLSELQVTYTTGVMKRTSLMHAGSLQVKVPLTVELVEILGSILALAVLAAIALLISSAFRSHRSERTTAPQILDHLEIP